MNSIIDQRYLTITEPEMRALPHGIVRLDKNGAILYYDGASKARSLGKPDWLGLRLFSDVSPCEPVSELQGHYERFVAKQGSRIEAHPFTFRFPFGDRRVTFTMVRRANSDDGLYVVVNSTPVEPAGAFTLPISASLKAA